MVWKAKLCIPKHKHAYKKKKVFSSIDDKNLTNLEELLQDVEAKCIRMKLKHTFEGDELSLTT